MSETTVISSNEPENESVLGEAAVAAAALSGAAAAKADDAQADAESAEAIATEAVSRAEHALSVAGQASASSISRDEVVEIVKTENQLILERLAEMISAKSEPVESESDKVPEEVKPTSVEKAAKSEKKTFRQRYLGLDS